MSTIPVEAIEAAVDQSLRKMAKKKKRGTPRPNLRKYRWKEGQTGNPGGKRKPPKNLDEGVGQELGNPDEILAIARALIANAKDRTHPAQMRAAELLFDRTCGKPLQRTEHSGSIGLYRVELIGLSPDEMARAADLFRPPVGGELAENAESNEDEPAQRDIQRDEDDE
jgi:hypothetical protein